MTRSMTPSRLRFEPLAAYVGTVYGPRAMSPKPSTRPMPGMSRHGRHTDWAPLCPARAVAVALGDTIAWRRAATRWVHTGLTLATAERVADELGVTCWDIWGFDYAAALPEMELA